ncbi:hypothetical protein [Hymenobacter frigidus]|uniref:hypothetical protein n=1 Tax=Hymenobacter frigidus TaxID=1524095 RepID=UPI0016633463|nr:hypothetical protein [Hymenobacter frigidus]
MKQLAHSSWLFILLSLPVATVGWFLKLGGQAGADAYIIIGTGLVVVFCALALQRLVRRLDLPVLAPLGLFGMGLALLTFETLAQPLSWAASLTLRMLGELLAASGTGWLLIRLNRVWDQKVAALRRLRRRTSQPY